MSNITSPWMSDTNFKAFTNIGQAWLTRGKGAGHMHIDGILIYELIKMAKSGEKIKALSLLHKLCSL